MPTSWTVRAILRATIPALAALTLLELGAGLVLGAAERTLLSRPTLLVLVPVTIGTAGNLGSVLAARLSTALHLGTLSFAVADEELVGAAVATVLLAATVFPAVGVGAWALVAALGDPRLGPWRAVAIATASGLLLAVLVVAVATTVTAVAYRRELDPDDVAVPVVTSVCDVLGVVVLVAVATVLP